jgi:formate dehydrogenase
MNSWLNELPGLHPGGKTTEVLINPKDAVELGVGEGDRVRVFSPVAGVELTATLSERPRQGLVIIEHGWGSRVFDPRGGADPQGFGVNRNLLVDAADLDPLSQTSALGATYVGITRLA